MKNTAKRNRVMLWELGLFIAVLAAAVAADAVENTDFLRISEEEIVFDHWNSTAERAKVKNCEEAGGECMLKKTVKKTCNGKVDTKSKCDKKNYVCCISAKVKTCQKSGGECMFKKTVKKTCNGKVDTKSKCDKKNYVCCISGPCSPTISCTLLGGYCFKGRNSNCDGTVDPWGCRGGKECKCCIPDHTTPEPPTCPACTCAPCPTKEGTASSTTATTEPTATTSATTAITTGISIDTRCAAIDGFLMSNQCFKLYNDQWRSWTEAQNKCQEGGLELAEIPDEDAVNLRKFIIENYGNIYVWLGARGSGSQMRWERSGEEIMSSNALWYPGGYTVSTSNSNYCLLMMAYNWAMQQQPTRPYWADPCSAHLPALCEVVME